MSENTEKKATFKPIHTYSLMDSPSIKGVKVLVKDTIPVKCHKCDPIPTMGLDNQVKMSYELCGTNCSRAIIGTEDMDVFMFQNCEVSPMKYLVGKYEPKDEK